MGATHVLQRRQNRTAVAVVDEHAERYKSPRPRAYYQWGDMKVVGACWVDERHLKYCIQKALHGLQILINIFTWFYFPKLSGTQCAN